MSVCSGSECCGGVSGIDCEGDCGDAMNDEIEKLRADLAAAKVENSNLLAELHEVDSPTGQVYESECSRLAKDLAAAMSLVEKNEKAGAMLVEAATAALSQRDEACADLEAARVEIGRLHPMAVEAKGLRISLFDAYQVRDDAIDECNETQGKLNVANAKIAAALTPGTPSRIMRDILRVETGGDDDETA